MKTMSLASFLDNGIELKKYHAPANTIKQGILTSDYLAEQGTEIIKKICWSLWLSLVDVSRVLAFVGCMVGIMLYVGGVPKGKQIAGGSLFGYIVIKLINMCLGG